MRSQWTRGQYLYSIGHENAQNDGGVVWMWEALVCINQILILK
jgi:hypothetical protein